MAQAAKAAVALPPAIHLSMERRLIVVDIACSPRVPEGIQKMTLKDESNGVAGVAWSGSGLFGLKWAGGRQPFCSFRRDFTVWRWESQVAHAFHAAGGNCLDTAHLYGDGDNERAVGQWINERGLRDEIVILGKGAHNSQDRKRVTPYDILSDLHDSLARFKVDSIDLCLLHKDDP